MRGSYPPDYAVFQRTVQHKGARTAQDKEHCLDPAHFNPFGTNFTFPIFGTIIPGRTSLQSEVNGGPCNIIRLFWKKRDFWNKVCQNREF